MSARDVVIFIALIAASIAPSSRITRDNTASAPIAANVLPLTLILSRTNRDADRAIRSALKEAAAPRDVSTPRLPSKYITPANTRITPVNEIKAPRPPLSPLAALVMSANVLITVAKAIVAAARSLIGTKDNAAIATAITPIATDIPIIVALQSTAPLEAKSIPAIIVDNRPIATIPFARFSSSM